MNFGKKKRLLAGMLGLILGCVSLLLINVSSAWAAAEEMEEDVPAVVLQSAPEGWSDACWDAQNVSLPGGGTQQNMMMCYCYPPTGNCYYNPADTAPYCTCNP